MRFIILTSLRLFTILNNSVYGRRVCNSNINSAENLNLAYYLKKETTTKLYSHVLLVFQGSCLIILNV